MLQGPDDEGENVHFVQGEVDGTEQDVKSTGNVYIWTACWPYGGRTHGEVDKRIPRSDAEIGVWTSITSFWVLHQRDLFACRDSQARTAAKGHYVGLLSNQSGCTTLRLFGQINLSTSCRNKNAQGQVTGREAPALTVAMTKSRGTCEEWCSRVPEALVEMCPEVGFGITVLEIPCREYEDYGDFFNSEV
ncbi:unnamed protein product [Protopolystoma xenopodis]|uniref:Uncharacterized protein n=1 Tax=Protopolystoma xenopodis TaxID=117903 RepID=A0A3S5FGD5_9PLAT|nr:unnamed protein product [Protopolystoma xenopodis]